MKKHQIKGRSSGFSSCRYYILLSVSCFVMMLSQSLNAQGNAITLRAENLAASVVFSQIERQCDYKFFYKTEVLEELKNISIHIENASLAEVLTRLFDNSGFTYEIEGKQIVVLERKTNNQTASEKTTVVVTGSVKDVKGEPLIGVAVVIKGTTTGVTTDVNGQFTIKAAPSAKLQFSFLGMKMIEKPVSASHRLDVVMEEDAKVMEEVVVTGYGNFKKSTYTGSASVIDFNKMKNLPVVSLTQMLEANLPGVSSSITSGQPGANVSLNIRGVGSFNASTEPLYILDGVPVISGQASGDSENAGGLGFLSTLNPADIENVTILKDAASASLYGARGANGVVLITTKKGNEGKTTYNIKASYGVSDFATPYREVMGGDERRQLIYEGLMNNALDNNASNEEAKLFADGQIDNYAAKPAGGWSNWNDRLFQKGHQQDYSLSASGGSKNTQFAGSLNYTKQEGVTIASGFERFGGHLNFRNQYKRFELAMNTLISLTKNKAPREAYYYASPLYASRYSLTPSVPIYNEDGTYNTNIPLNGNRNPLQEAELNKNYTQVVRTFASVEGGVNIIEGLKLSTVFNVDMSYTKEFRYSSPLSGDGKDLNGDGRIWMNENIRYNSNTRLNYNRSFGLHRLDATVAYEIQNWDYEGMQASAQDYTSSRLETLDNATDYVSIGHNRKGDAMLSYVGRLNYDYNDRYYLGLSYRRDGSSRLPADNRWDNFWSVSGSWRISQENFMQGLSNWLSDMKFRVSYGVNGNIPYLLYGHMGTFSTSWQYNDQPAMVEANIANRSLSWEKNYALNVGVDFTLFSRVNVTFDWYKRRTKDLLMDRQIDGLTGFSSYLDNIGELENKGVELEIKSTNIQKNGFVWTSALNLSHNKNKVVKLADLDEYATGWFYRKAGYSLGTLYLIEYAGVNPDNGEPQFYTNTKDANGVRSREIVNDPRQVGYVPMQDIYPKVSGGFTNSFRYKFVDFSFQLSYSLGGHSIDTETASIADDGHSLEHNLSTDLRRRWQKPGDITDIPRYVAGREYGGWWITSRNIHSTDHLRLKNLIIGVNAPTRWLNVLGMSQARVYFSGNNLLTWAKNKLYDPELTGSVGFNIPPLKTYAFGIEIGL